MKIKVEDFKMTAAEKKRIADGARKYLGTPDNDEETYGEVKARVDGLDKKKKS